MSDYPVVSITNAPEELNRLHAEIEGKMRSTVADAIRAGEILSQVKGRLPHGDFLPWVKVNCRFSDKTAEKYMALHIHSCKIESSSNLQEAYHQVENLEAQERKTDDQKARERVTAFVKTGKKPEGWRRGTDDKLAEERRESDEHFAAEQEKWKAKTDDRIRESEKHDGSARGWARDAEQRDAESAERASQSAKVMAGLSELSASLAKRQTFKESIRVSHEGKDDPFVDAIMDYLETLDDDSRRIEACHNIIKVCKGIANQLQEVKGASDQKPEARE